MGTGVFTTSSDKRQKKIGVQDAIETYPGAEIGIDEEKVSKRIESVQYNPDDLFTMKGVEIYQKMMRDPEINHCMNAFITFRKSSGWTIESGTEQAEVEQKDFVKFVFDNIEGGIEDDIKEILFATHDGISIMEIVWDYQKGGKYDGKLIIHALKHKNPKYFNVVTDDFSNPIHIKNISSGDHYGEVYPITKFVVYSFNRQYENVWGEPRIRSLYAYWYLKQLFERCWGIYLEKFGVPHVVIKRPVNVDPNLRDSLIDVVKKVRIETGFVLPANVDYTVTQLDATAGTMYRDAIESINRQIQRTILGQTLSSDVGDKGSYAATKVHFDELMMLETELGTDVSTKAINKQIIQRLIEVNYGKQDKYPEFKFNSLEKQDIPSIVDKYLSAVEKGVIKQMPDDENTLRRGLGMKEREISDEEYEVAENNVGTTASITPDNIYSDTFCFSEKLFTGVRRRTMTRYEQHVDFTEIRDTLDLRTENTVTDIGKQLETAVEETKRWLINKNILGNKDFQSLRKLSLKIGDFTPSVKRIYQDKLQVSFQEGMRIAKREVVAKKRIAKKYSESVRFAEMDIRQVNYNEAIQWLNSLAYSLAGKNQDSISSIFTRRVQEAIKNGYTQSQMVDNIDTDLEGYFNAGEPGDAEYYSGFRIKTIANTYTAGAYNMGRKTMFEDPSLEGYVEAYQYSAILDDRVRPNHAEMDGRVFRVTDLIWSSWQSGRGWFPPAGYNCRCTIVPVTQMDAYTISGYPAKNVVPDAGFVL